MSTESEMLQALDLGKSFYNRGDLQAAQPYLEQVVAVNQKFADAYNMLGVIYYHAGLFNRAFESLEMAITINPNYTEAALNLAIVYNDIGQYERGAMAYQRAAQVSNYDSRELDPFVAGKMANMHSEVAQAYRTAGCLNEALEEYRKALDLRPEFGDIRTKLASVLRELNAPHMATAELQKALSDRPAYLPARLQLGVCYYHIGRMDEALEQWMVVLKQDPDNPSAKVYIRLINDGVGIDDKQNNIGDAGSIPVDGSNLLSSQDLKEVEG